jgi:pimeloyl-ACP methyl ester carboxylesterase
MIRTARFLRGWYRPSDRVVETEETIESGNGPTPATLYRPRGAEPRHGWVVLHGITVPGRAHPSLRRFASSLAHSGGVVLVPEIAAWRDLRVDPEAADRAIAAAAEHLRDMPGVLPGGVGVVGFSFGATQALITAARPELGDAIRTVVGFGGYCDPIATFVYAFTGEHEWRGIRSHLPPDPYGRWIVTANYLTGIPEFATMERVARGAHRLAIESGARGVFAGDPVLDPFKAAVRAGLLPAEREVWDLVAPTADRPPPLDETRHVGTLVANAALARHPGLDPRPVLANLRHPTVLAHGYYDQLIPYTETLQLHERLADHAPSYLSISRLFAHSKAAPPLRLRDYPLEALRYARLLDRALSPPRRRWLRR